MRYLFVVSFIFFNAYAVISQSKNDMVKINSISVYKDFQERGYTTAGAFKHFGDKGDKYRTGAGEINTFGFGVGFNVFTGEPNDLDKDNTQGPNGTYTKGPNSNPDEYRAGGFYFKTPLGKLGKNSEKSRALVQNLIIHKHITSSPYFKNLGSGNDYYYYQSGAGIGFLY
jgi:hypothetical protein